MSISVRGISISVRGVTISVRGVSISVRGVYIFVRGVSISVICVSISVRGVSISVGVFLSLSLSVFSYSVTGVSFRSVPIRVSKLCFYLVFQMCLCVQRVCSTISHRSGVMDVTTHVKCEDESTGKYVCKEK